MSVNLPFHHYPPHIRKAEHTCMYICICTYFDIYMFQTRYVYVHIKTQNWTWSPELFGLQHDKNLLTNSGQSWQKPTSATAKGVPNVKINIRQCLVNKRKMSSICISLFMEMRKLNLFCYVY